MQPHWSAANEFTWHCLIFANMHWLKPDYDCLIRLICFQSFWSLPRGVGLVWSWFHCHYFGRVQDVLWPTSQTLLHLLLRQNLSPSPQILQEAGEDWCQLCRWSCRHPPGVRRNRQTAAWSQQPPNTQEEDLRVSSALAKVEHDQGPWAAPAKPQVQLDGNRDGQISCQKTRHF